MSDVDLSVLAGQRDDDDPPILTPRPDSTEERLLSSPVLLHPGLEAETRPGDLSGESDGLQSPPGGGDLADQCGRYRFDSHLNEKKEIHCSLTLVTLPAK